MRKLFFFCSLLIICSCEDPFTSADALIFTGDILSVEDSGAVFSARIADRGNYPIVESGFIWNMQANTGEGIKIKNPDNSVDKFSLPTTHPLVQNQTYTVKAYVTTTHATTYGNTLVFESSKKAEAATPWPATIDGHPNGTIAVKSSFNFKDKTYFLGVGMYAFNHVTKQLTSVIQNEITDQATFSVVKGQDIYIFTQNRFYTFNPDNLQLTPLAVVPNDNLTNANGFLIGDNIFINANYGLYRYNIPTNTWKKMTTPPYFGFPTTFFSSQNKIHVVGGGWARALHSWTYDDEGDTWKENKTFPEAFTVNAYAQCGIYSVTQNGQQYLFNNFSLYAYVSEFNTWIKKTESKLNSCYGLGHVFSYNDSIFVIRIASTNQFTLWTYAE